MSAVQVAQMKFENELLYVVELRVLGENEHGYLLQVDVQHSTQQATDLFSRVLADVNQVSSSLVLQADAHGRLVEVKNQAEIQRKWQAASPAIRARYASEPAVQPFLDTFEQQLALPGSMEVNLRTKGVHSALLAGLYGQAYATEPVVSHHVIPGFFNELDLPLLLATQAEEAADDAAIVLISRTGSLDTAAFSNQDFRRLIRGIVDDYTFDVALEIDCQAHFALHRHTGALLRSRQHLRAEVPGVYHNSITHEIFPHPSA
ncbi:hypothetical protein HHL22_07835 [Hymenobacter sp. RP-2-7]|uniref:Uncharacterized protein n=1 Tax=Hymenobacter polaris TaxID=2682546 RepID=A0A7Y0FM39_9BACT|nr:hypothetical protein [Hymenobacter polaris]NML65115.1 hypothetical protein [Hymenobacter polaris]